MDWLSKTYMPIFKYEKQLEFPEGFNLSRILMTNSDYQQFKESLSDDLGSDVFAFLNITEKFQLFVDWYLGSEITDFQCRVYNI